jgi:hypothetical protein
MSLVRQVLNNEQCHGAGEPQPPLSTVERNGISAQTVDGLLERDALTATAKNAGINTRLLQDETKQKQEMKVAIGHHQLKRPCLPARSAMLRPRLTDPDDVTARSNDKHPTSRMIQRLASVTRRCAATSRYRQLCARYRTQTIPLPNLRSSGRSSFTGTLRGDCWLCTRTLSWGCSRLLSRFGRSPLRRS